MAIDFGKLKTDLVSAGKEVGRSGNITNSPACHGKRFGKTVQNNRVIFHSRERTNRNMLCIFVMKLTINFVRNTPKLIFYDNFCNFFKFFCRNHSSSRIIRRTNHDSFCFWSNCIFNLLSRRIITVYTRINWNYLNLAQFCQRNVVYITRLNCARLR